MIKSTLKNIHEGLSLTSLLLNCGIAFHMALSKFPQVGLSLIQDQITESNKCLPENGFIKDLHTRIAVLNWGNLKFSGDFSFSPESICKSGIAALLELRFSDSILPQTTHFGIVYPVLVLVYGDNWHIDGKLAMGLGCVGAFETIYWWMDCGKEDHSPEHN